ncbi:hypothetical protein VMCG_07143 [Cytospora schulzeri]|uniref:Fungal STAND N-terminal Goodbye domain-containing protein n=1 Tax=Cytospora schulzeri TaxID=448051 RepID=A0A423W4Y9_9PEZI|nr:hypothetical protein VMCG_07143 [Valsa malicola]
MSHSANDSQSPLDSHIGRRPLTVEFIDYHLPAVHPAFVDPPVHYDTMSQQYVLNSRTASASNDGALTTLSPGSSSDIYSPAGSKPLSTVSDPPPRPVWTDTKAMQYWNAIIPQALVMFRATTTEPKRQSNNKFRIRDKNDWDTIYETLELARDEYQKTGGPVGWLRKIRRKAADNVAPLAGAAFIGLKAVPENTYSTPVLGAVGVLLDAVKQAATIRKEVLEGFDGLIAIFSDVELFLGQFPGDSHIKDASLELTVTILTALEQAIGFFISNEVFRGGKALLKRGDYEQNLRNSLEEIKTKSTNLRTEATKSYQHKSEWYSHETLNMMQQVVEGQEELCIVTKTGFNSIERLLADHMREKDEIIAQKDRELEAKRQQNLFLLFENQRLQLRSASPLLHPSQWTLPTPPQASTMEWYINQESLRRILNTRNLDQMDMESIIDKKEQIPARQQAQAEQIVNAPLFRDWIVSTSSAKLLVQWDTRLPQSIAEVTPLSIFCTTMVKALQTKDRFMSVQWFCGQHIDPFEAGPYVGGHAMLASLIDQLLRQFAFDTKPLHREITLAGLQAGNSEELKKMLGWLVRQLPPAITLFCIVDGVVLYERDEHWDEAAPVLAYLLSLTADPTVQVAVKVLFTSTPGPVVLRGPFEDENLILNVDTLPRLAWAPSEERVARELGDGL